MSAPPPHPTSTIRRATTDRSDPTPGRFGSLVFVAFALVTIVSASVLSVVFGDAFGVAAVALLISLVSVVVSLTTRPERCDGSIRRRRPGRRRGVRLAARMVPSAGREEVLEEWAAWLLDLRLDGEPWWRRLLEVVSLLLVAAPRLAVILRRSPGRAADR